MSRYPDTRHRPTCVPSGSREQHDIARRERRMLFVIDFQHSSDLQPLLSSRARDWPSVYAPTLFARRCTWRRHAQLYLRLSPVYIGRQNTANMCRYLYFGFIHQREIDGSTCFVWHEVECLQTLSTASPDFDVLLHCVPTHVAVAARWTWHAATHVRLLPTFAAHSKSLTHPQSMLS